MIDLQRFIDAQDHVFKQVLVELRAGRKRSHWMWFIFPQMLGLGHSEVAKQYGIVSLEEAVAYLKHPVLGPRLMECTLLVNRVEGRPIEEILGFPDDLKFRSCMTLFARATAENSAFLNALEKYFQGEEDQLTLAKLSL